MMAIVFTVVGVLFPTAVYIYPGLERLGWENQAIADMDDIESGDHVKLLGIIESNETVALNGTEYYHYAGTSGYRWIFDHHNITLRNADNTTHVVLVLREARIRKGPHPVDGYYYMSDPTSYWNNDTVYAVGTVERKPDGRTVLMAEVVSPVNDFGSADYFRDGFNTIAFFTIPMPLFVLFLFHIKRKSDQLIGKGSYGDARIPLEQYAFGKGTKDYPNAEHQRTLRRARQSYYVIPFAAVIGPTLILLSTLQDASFEMLMAGIMAIVILMMVPVIVGSIHNGTPVRTRIKSTGFQVQYPLQTREYMWDDIASMELEGCSRDKDRTAQIMVRLKVGRISALYLHPLSWELADSLLLESKNALAGGPK